MDHQLDRLGVQLSEARRLTRHGGVPRNRLALLLLDNAAETLLRLSATTYLARADLYGNMMRRLEPARPHADEAEKLAQELGLRVVSASRRRKIDRDFNELVDFVFEHDDWSLDPEMAACIKILHRYRNAAYHRDKVYPDVLEPAVIIYFYLVAHLLKHRKSSLWLIDQAPPGVLEVLDGDDLGSGFLGLPGYSSEAFQAAMADRILRDFIPDSTRVSESLSKHMLARLDGIDRDLKEIGDYHGPPDVERDFAIRVVQCTDAEWHADGPPRDFWTRRFAVTGEVIQAWKADALKLAGVTRALDALRMFAEQESSIVKFEERASELAFETEGAIQFESDLRRGK
ncbi:hypothetical protein AB0I37_22875 [Micromonospora purpureochromogenes]|uniref:hypothetical protein n=1 Tax=Micromonospora purpureochromogenes TaxID=47872 RepID=UPI0033C99F98